MQACFVGTAVSGVLVAVLRIITKAMYTQDGYGLRQSANLYFIVSFIVMLLNVVLFNLVHKLPVIKYYNDLRTIAENGERKQKGDLTGKQWRSTLVNIIGAVKWHGSGILIIYIVTLSIFPGSITEDVHSVALKDWYPILLITGFSVFDLIGKSLTSLYLMENANAAIGASFGRLLFWPIFYGCLHGPKYFRTEFPVMLLTCVLGLTNGYFTSVLMILAPKTVELQHAEAAGIVLVLYLVVGLAIGSVISWFWIL